MAEIRCYGSPKVANGLVLVITGGLSLMVIAGIMEGNYLATLVVAAIGYSAIFLVWVASRHGTFIAVDPDTKTLRASNFFIPTKSIPIDAITHIGMRGMFVGAATEIEITYQKPNGRKKTVGYGTTNFLNPKDLKRVFDEVTKINPTLRVPKELINSAWKLTSGWTARLGRLSDDQRFNDFITRLNYVIEDIVRKKKK